jgi:terminase large subunit-like protein
MKVGTLSKTKLWGELAYRPNPAQEKVHASRARNRVNCAGRRTGKSVAGGREVMPWALGARMMKPMYDQMGIRAEYWIVGPNYTDSEKEFRVFFNDCRRKGMPFDKPGTYYDPKGNMSVSLWEGAFILHAKSGAHPESLVGEGLHGVIMSEAAKLKESVWQRFIRPTLADFAGESVWNTTPEGKNWFYDIYMAGQGTDPEWASWRHPSWVNNHVFRKHTTKADVDLMKDMLRRSDLDPAAFEALAVDPEIIAMARDLTPESFMQEVEASFSEHVGRVFKEWDDEYHMADLPYRADWPLYIATDYGYTDPNVALFIQPGPFGECNVIAEYYRTHRTDREFAMDVKTDPRMGRLLNFARGLFPDPADPAATEELSKMWGVPVMGGTGGELKARRLGIEKKLSFRNPHLPWDHPERVPWLRFDRTCTMARYEMDAWRWPDKRKTTRTDAPEQPMDKDNHVPEALGRFFAGFGWAHNTDTVIQKNIVHQSAPRRRRRPAR